MPNNNTDIGRGGRGRGRGGRGGRGRGRGRGRGGRGRGFVGGPTRSTSGNDDDNIGAIDSLRTNLDQLTIDSDQRANAKDKKINPKKQNKQANQKSKNDDSKNVKKNDMQNNNKQNNKQKKKNSDQARNNSNNKGVKDNIGNTKDKDKNKKSDKNKKRDKSISGDNSNTTPSIPPSQPQTTNDLNYKKGSPITVLHIAEKPSIAQAIAKGLAKGASFNSNSHSKLPIYEFTVPSSTQPFPKAPFASKCTHRVSSVAGHVYSVDFPSTYQSWDSVDPAELFHAPIQKKPCQGSVVKHLQSCSKNVDFIVLWLDCDREGENIAFEVLDCCLHLMNSSGNSNNYDRVYRAYFSAINTSDIQKAYGQLGKPDKNQSLAVDARQELDLKVGVAFSRFQTRYFQGRYGDLDSAVLSYGPCQTPT